MTPLMVLLLPLLMTFVAAATADQPITPITDPALCHCHDNFEARPYGDEGEYRCHGLFLRIIRPCNTAKRPRCLCTEATSVLTDHRGVWCAQYGGGREVRRWRCENVQEWEQFFGEHPDQRFQEIAL